MVFSIGNSGKEMIIYFKDCLNHWSHSFVDFNIIAFFLNTYGVQSIHMQEE